MEREKPKKKIVEKKKEGKKLNKYFQKNLKNLIRMEFLLKFQ